MYRPSIGAIAIGLLGLGADALQQPAIHHAPAAAPNGGRPSGAAAARRAARRLRNVRAKSPMRRK